MQRGNDRHFRRGIGDLALLTRRKFDFLVLLLLISHILILNVGFKAKLDYFPEKKKQLRGVIMGI